MKDIKNLIKNRDFLIKDLGNGEPVTHAWIYTRKKIQPDGSIDKLKLSILVRRDLENKEIIGDTWYQTESMRNIKYFLADDYKQK